MQFVKIPRRKFSSGGGALVMDMRQVEAAAEAGINLGDIELNLADVLKPEIHVERCPHCFKFNGILCTLNRDRVEVNRISLLDVALMTGNDRVACMLVGFSFC